MSQGRWWSETEWQKARAMAAEGALAGDIAKACNRSIKAVLGRFAAQREKRPPLLPPGTTRDRRPWTPSEISRARKMKAQGAALFDIAFAINRSPTAVSEKLTDIRMKENAAMGLPPRAGSPAVAQVSAALLAERDRRALAADRRTITQAMLGDPPPGYSALDRRS